MAGKQIVGDGVTSNLAEMSKSQLYDIMFQMKTLIEQNHQQARQILIQNPQLTKGLFQAQIMLGMVQPPQAIPSIPPSAPQHNQQAVQAAQQPAKQSAHAFPSQVNLQEQANPSQNQFPPRKPQPNQPVMPMPFASVPAVNLPSQPMPSHPKQTLQQSKGPLNPLMTPMNLPQSAQLSNLSSLPRHSSSQPAPPLNQLQVPAVSSQMQQPMGGSGVHHMPLQPPLPPQPRPPSMPHHHQYPPQMGHNSGYQPSSAPQQFSQPMYHPGAKPPPGIGPSFPQQGQLPHQSQLPQSLYQGSGSHLGSDFNSQSGNSMQIDRGSSWMGGPIENSAATQLPGPSTLNPGQMGPGNQPPRPAGMSSEMEKALLQQVMSLTPEQINLLPLEQRNQVLQLQQMLRQ